MTAFRAPSYPFRFDYGGVADVANVGSWLKQAITQWILTSRKERVHRPLYGGGLYDILFADPDDEIVDMTLARIADGITDRFGVDVMNIRRTDDGFGTFKIEINYSVGGVPDQLYVDITDVITDGP